MEQSEAAREELHRANQDLQAQLLAAQRVEEALRTSSVQSHELLSQQLEAQRVQLDQLRQELAGTLRRLSLDVRAYRGSAFGVHNTTWSLLVLCRRSG